MKNTIKNNAKLYQSLITASQITRNPKDSDDPESAVHYFWNLLLQTTWNTKDQKTFRKDLQEIVGKDVELEIYDQVIQTEQVAEKLFRIIREAQEKTVEIKVALREWRESNDCLNVLKQQSMSINIDPSNPFLPLLEAIFTTAGDTRAELIARFETYCESGWATVDLIEDSSDKPPTKFQSILREASHGKQIDSKDLINALHGRLQEVSVPIQITDYYVQQDEEQMTVAFVEIKTNSPSTADESQTEKSRRLDVAIPMANDPKTLLIANVTANTSRLDKEKEGDLQTSRQFYSIVTAGAGIPFKKVISSFYIRPLVRSSHHFEGTGKSLRNDFEKALHAISDEIPGAIKAVNHLQLLSEANVISDDPRAALCILQSEYRPLGEPSLAPANSKHIWKSTADRLLVAAQALLAAHKNNPDIFKAPSSDGRLAIRLLGNATRSVRQYGMDDPEVLATFENLNPCLESLSRVFLRACGQIKNKAVDFHQQCFGQIMDLNFGPRVNQATMSEAYAYLNQRQKWIQKTREIPGLITLGTQFAPSRVNERPGAIDAICSTSSPSLGKFIVEKILPNENWRSYLYPTAIGQRVISSEIPTQRTQDRILNSKSILEPASKLLSKAWDRIESLKDASPEEKEKVREAFLKRFDFFLEDIVNNDNRWNLETVPERLLYAVQAVSAYSPGWTDQNNKEAIKKASSDGVDGSMLNIAMACPDVNVVKKLSITIQNGLAPYPDGWLQQGHFESSLPACREEGDFGDKRNVKMKQYFLKDEICNLIGKLRESPKPKNGRKSKIKV